MESVGKEMGVKKEYGVGRQFRSMSPTMSIPLRQVLANSHTDLPCLFVEHGADATAQATPQIQQPGINEDSIQVESKVGFTEEQCSIVQLLSWRAGHNTKCRNCL